MFKILISIFFYLCLQAQCGYIRNMSQIMIQLLANIVTKHYIYLPFG